MLFDDELNFDVVYLFIQELHFNSCTSDVPFFVVCCAMLPYKHHSYLILPRLVSMWRAAPRHS
jgi:hypothetical protein